LFAIFGFIANAQLTIVPQLGVESSRTSIQLNDLPSFSPAGVNYSPQVGVRLDYKFKQLHGPFLGLSTSRSIVEYNFSDAATAMSSYTTSRGSTQLRLEGGYQVSTKPIYFKKSAAVNNSPTPSCRRSLERTSCAGKAAKSSTATAANKGSWVSIQPSLGVAFVPFAPTREIYATAPGNSQTGYAYNAGNYTSAVITGVGFEFGKGAKRTFVISVNYLQSLGDQVSESVTQSGNKPTTTKLESGTSGWSVRMGIPIGFKKEKQTTPKPPVYEKNYKNYYQGRCGQYRSQCRKVI